MEPVQPIANQLLPLQLQTDPTTGPRVLRRRTLQPRLPVQPGHARSSHECVLCLCGAVWSVVCAWVCGGVYNRIKVLFVEAQQETWIVIITFKMGIIKAKLLGNRILFIFSLDSHLPKYMLQFYSKLMLVSLASGCIIFEYQLFD